MKRTSEIDVWIKIAMPVLGPETKCLDEPKAAVKIVPKIAENKPAVGGRPAKRE